MPLNNNRRAKKGLTLLFSLFPGGGHFYMGLMRRGAFYCALILLSVALSSLFLLDTLAFWIALAAYAISIFDAYHCRRLMQEENVEVMDVFPMEDWFNARMSNMDEEQRREFRNKTMRGAGIALLALGALSAFSTLMNWFYQFLDSDSSYLLRLFSGLTRFLTNLLFPALLVLAGLYLIRRGKRKNDEASGK